MSARVSNSIVVEEYKPFNQIKNYQAGVPRHNINASKNCTIVRSGAWHFDVESRCLGKDGQSKNCCMSPLEARLLKILMEAEGRLVPVEPLVKELLQHSSFNKLTDPCVRVQSTMMSLRRRIRAVCPGDAEHLVVKKGVGYRFQP